jgi:hypothetical protein
VWLWCELTCGHERAGPVALPTSNLAHQGEFIRDALPDLRERLVIFGRLLLATPADARGMLPARFEALLGERGDVIFRPDSTGRRLEPHERRERPIPPRVPLAVADRVLAHVAAHTGVDILTLTTISFPGMQAPPAVIHARLLAAALLQRTWPTSWNAIGEAINQNGNRPLIGSTPTEGPASAIMARRRARPARSRRRQLAGSDRPDHPARATHARRRRADPSPRD